MTKNNFGYRFIKYKNGLSYFATVNLEIEKNDNRNQVIENYSGIGYSNHSVDVGKIGMEDWKKGLIKGLEFVLSYSPEFMKITVHQVSGKPITDTNPTIVGYTAILAVLEKVNISIDPEKLEQLENFVYKSWENGNDQKIPDFENLRFIPLTNN